ncbi:hypothetical protein [Acinetobacter wuhouensis]|uniref:Uncharacterized protein n=1 Tax=Acinetobacter wuhouensis TaxID=1879050 RepID=A0A4Q7AIK3_9GAMM|nr:hypothetical protein [Acinetobacter wuhouensis]RZG48057.1 hypothetical protein EXU28_04625 [Acinetobacter wuhouensis]
MKVVKKFLNRKISEAILLFDLQQFNNYEKLKSIVTLLFMFVMGIALNLILTGILFEVIDNSTLNVYEILFNQIVISVLVFLSGYSSQCVKIAKMK